MYQMPQDKGPELYQGDIINRAELIRLGALRGHQDYMASRDDFCGFCIVTQSCDLVYGRTADFITLAVIRQIADVFDARAKEQSTRDKLCRLINHSEDKLGYFYLHREPAIGIDEGAVVDLRVMFSLHSALHYDQLLSAKRMSLTDVYANKLGWMAGYLFSRVPLREWQELKLSETEGEVATRLLKSINERGGPKLPHEKPL
jgi:hypothetical protein